MNICLDSWAVIDWLEDGPSAASVEKVISHRPVISLVNVCEVLYILSRKHGDTAILQVLPALRQKLAFIEVDEDLTLSASQIKAAHKMALGDAFCVATALAHNAKILTGDPEIINAKGNWKVQDLR
ncbi:MAG: type II toxin-antitoxin system VapC family toxin [Ilumatobacteraceae bacterium]|jgi:PIN domain nuclease of toxin-antitoxin system